MRSAVEPRRLFSCSRPDSAPWSTRRRGSGCSAWSSAPRPRRRRRCWRSSWPGSASAACCWAGGPTATARRSRSTPGWRRDRDLGRRSRRCCWPSSSALYVALGGSARLGLAGQQRRPPAALAGGPRAAHLPDGRHAAGGGAGGGDGGPTSAAARWACSTRVNTLGAVLGALLTTFFALETLGIRKTHLDRGAAQPAGGAGGARASPASWPRGQAREPRRRPRSRAAAAEDAAQASATAGRPARAGRGGGGRLRLPADGAGLVPHAGAAARRLLLHLRADPGGGAAGDRPRRRSLYGAGARRAPAHDARPSPPPARWRRC